MNLYTEKFRPTRLKEIAISKENKDILEGYLKNPLALPSFIFYSSSPGTGKTTVAKAIANELDCDFLKLNASDERGIETIREKIKLFVYSLSSKEGIKRLVFLDEADGLTRQALDSLRNLMEDCSDNAFFILSCNDLSKIIEPIQSRCVCLNFETPDEVGIHNYLHSIIQKENIDITDEQLQKLQSFYYPDIRTMVLKIQNHSIDAETSVLKEEELIHKFIALLNKRNIREIYEFVYSKEINLEILNRFIFKNVFENTNLYTDEQLKIIADKLADTEKYHSLGANKQVVFLGNLIQILQFLRMTP
jgi:replication factor C small subunit